MAPLVKPASWATSSSVASSTPRSANTVRPACSSRARVSALRRWRTIPMRINDTDENRLSQTSTRNDSLDTHGYLFAPQNALLIASHDSTTQRLGPGPAPATTRPEEADHDQPSRRNPRRSEPAVRPRRARRPDTRPDVLDLPAPDCRVVLRDQREGHVPGMPWSDHGGVESRVPSPTVRQGTRLGRRGRGARCRSVLRHRGPDRLRVRSGGGGGRPARGCCGPQRLERPGRVALPATGDVPHLQRRGRNRLDAHRARAAEGTAGALPLRRCCVRLGRAARPVPRRRRRPGKNRADHPGHARARPLALLFGIAFLLALAYAAPIII